MAYDIISVNTDIIPNQPIKKKSTLNIIYPDTQAIDSMSNSDLVDIFTQQIIDKFKDDDDYRLRFRQTILDAIRVPEIAMAISQQVSFNPSIITEEQPKASIWEGLRSNFLTIKYLLLSVAIAGIVMMIPMGDSLSPQGHRAMAIFVAIITLWVTEAIPLPVTSLLACVLFALFRVVPHTEAFVGFGNSTVFFLIGALLLGVAIVKVNLHKRVALFALKTFGTNPGKLVGAVVVTGAVMTLFLPTHGVGAMLFPIMVTVMVARNESRNSNFAKAVILAVAYGTNVGSMGTLLGGARNPLAAGLYQEYSGNSVSFIDWIIAALPLVVVMTFFVYLVLKYKFSLTEVDLNDTKKFMEKEVQKLGKISWREKRVIGIFGLTFLSWAIFGTTVGLAVVAISSAVILLVSKLISWEDVEKKMSWNIIFLYGGAITMGKIIGATGVAEFISKKLLVSTGIGNSPYLLIVTITVLSMTLTQLMSNAAATSVILPIALPVMQNAGIPPIIAMYCVALNASLAFMLPIATPCSAMAYSTKYITVRDLLRTGIWLNIIAIIVVMTVGVGYWKLIGLF